MTGYLRAEIRLIDFRKSLAQRKADRKFTSGYRWNPPATPSTGVGFYMASKRLAMDEHGARLRLRLAEADEFIPRHSRLSGVEYYCDSDQCETLKPIVAYLPHRRGFLAGWTLGQGCCAELDGHIWPTLEEAALAAHDETERAAELWRADDERQGEPDEADENPDWLEDNEETTVLLSIQNRRKVIVSRVAVALFNASWPCSKLDPKRHYWFEFDERGDLIDTDVPEHSDGPEASALADDCKAYLAGKRPSWLP